MTPRSRSSVRWLRAGRAIGWLGPWLALASLSIWAADPDAPTLLLAAVGVTATVLWGPTRPGRAWGAGTVVLVVAILAGFAAHRQVDALSADWPKYWSTREAAVGATLNSELESRLDAGESATTALLEQAEGLEDELAAAVARGLRLRYGASALALYGTDGRLRAWDGTHRGKVPGPARSGALRYHFENLPLFGYLYIATQGPGGEVALAAYLLRTDLPASLGADPGDFASALRRAVGEDIRISVDDPGDLEAVWDLDLGDRRLLSVIVQEPLAVDRAAAILRGWRAAVSALAVLAWLLLAAGGPRRVASGGLAASSLLFLAGTLPLGSIEALAVLFDPLRFELPGPVPITLGRVALMAATGFTAVAVLPRFTPTLPFWASGVLVASVAPAVVAWIGAGLDPTTLAEGRLEWIVYQVGMAACLSLPIGALLSVTLPRPAATRTRAVFGVAGAFALAGAGASLVWLTASLPAWWPVLWALPVAVAAASLGAWDGWSRPAIVWGLAMVLGSTIAIPSAWAHRVDARIARGSERLAHLAAPQDFDVERGLFALGPLADSSAAKGSRKVDILYQAWTGSGLAALGTPVRLSLWGLDGSLAEELRVGVGTDSSRMVSATLTQMREGKEPRLVQLGRDDARYVLGVPLPSGEYLTAVVPPFSDVIDRSPLGPLVRGDLDAEDPITMIPLVPSGTGPREGRRWVRAGTRWQGEVALDFANASYHAHYSVPLPGALLATARGSLLLVINALVFFSFWLVGRALMREVGPRDTRLAGLAISFRARVTLALFGFFVLANALFGTVAYRTLARASHRSARVIADRIVDDAARRYVAVSGEMAQLARQVGTDLLEFRDGELEDGSVREFVELGLYEGWMPFAHHLRLDGREGVRDFSEFSLGRWQYVTAYRRLPDGDILATQVPIQAGATAIETSDLIELLGFTVLLGAALSLWLAYLAGQALTRPIRALQAASESVGAGNLTRRLPSERKDEFGAVFRAFNRMVGRVRRSRRQLVRTTRRTQAIMEEAAVGMVALDPAGRVTLVNPRAEAWFGVEVHVGRPLPGQGAVGTALMPWLDSFLDGDAEEGGTELTVDERRLRLRVRRLGSLGTRRGVVLAVDDVTDELRTERVLAWGEMARQVAHEVKNPLTPIKLSIQHIRRAWADKRPEFDQILVKNADAMLSEIDRLAGIAQSFSRFGAPSENQSEPLAEVSVARVVDEVMALYGETDSVARFEQEVEADLPTVVARVTELKEVLVNLLENARAAVGDGGRVGIRARVEAGGVLLSVVDDGAGIPEELLPRIFEPRFSTRSTGTGLGLAIVQRLVRGWGGEVAARSTLDEGTEVTVRLEAWSDRQGGEDLPVRA